MNGIEQQKQIMSATRIVQMHDMSPKQINLWEMFTQVWRCKIVFGNNHNPISCNAIHVTTSISINCAVHMKTKAYGQLDTRTTIPMGIQHQLSHLVTSTYQILCHAFEVFSNCHFNTMMAGGGVWAMDSFHMKLQYSLIIGIQWCNDETNGIEIKFIHIPTKAVTFSSLQISFIDNQYYNMLKYI